MSEPTVLTIISFSIMVAVLVISEKVRANRVEAAVCQIVQELNKEEAYNPFTAVELPLVTDGFSRVGYRSFRCNAVEILSQQHIVKRTGTGKLYLKMPLKDERLQEVLGACNRVP
jgi:hypothetical protein